MDEFIELKALGELRNPVLISALAVRRRAGRLAANTLAYVIEQWAAEPVAKLEPDDFYDFTVRRPNVRYENDERVLDWPEPTFYRASPQGAERDFLLLAGFEPNFQWSRFVRALADYADAAGVKTLVNLRSFPGSVPHTRPAPVMLNASDVELELQFGVQSRGLKYEGPTDIGGLLSVHVQGLRWQTVDLSVLQPYYFPRMPNARATIAIVKLLDRAFGTDTPLGALEETAEAQTKAIDEGIVENAEINSSISELEEEYDKGVERLDFLAPGADQAAGLPPSNEVVEEIERIFRESGKLPESEDDE